VKPASRVADRRDAPDAVPAADALGQIAEVGGPGVRARWGEPRGHERVGLGASSWSEIASSAAMRRGYSGSGDYRAGD